MYCILIDAHLSDGDQLAMLDVFPLRRIDLFLFNVSTCVCVSTHSPIMYVLHSYRCPLLQWGSTGDAAMHDVFSLRGIDPFKVSTRVCISTHSLIMYVLHSYRCPPLRWGSTGDA